MSVSKALQFMGKKDLECVICLKRFHQPKTLKCMHTYCLQCIQKWVETHGKMKCPTCQQEHDLTKEDLKKLASNTLISQLLEYVMKTEDQKPTKCSSCENQPAYHCSKCQLYLCGGNCIKQHEAVSLDHPLYTLDIKEQDEFKKDANDVVNLAQEVKNELTEKLEVMDKSKLLFKSQLKLSRNTIGIQENKLIKKVQEKSKALILNMEKIYKEKEDEIDSKYKDIDAKRTQVNNLLASVKKLINKPEERETLESHKTAINTVRDKVLATDFDKSFDKINIIPNFIPCTQLDELMNTEGVGKIITADSMMYEVADDDKSITVTKGQLFVVKVSSPAESDACQLAATLINTTGEESPTEVEYDGNGEYKITVRCNVEGDWQMKITAGTAHIKGSPVNIKVETLGIVHTIDNISDYKENNKTENVTDVVLDTDGCILVSSYSKDILKFNQSGSFVARIQVPQDVEVDRMHRLCDGHIIYSDYSAKCVVKCDDKFQEVLTFGKEMLKLPNGLTVNKGTRALYVADENAHCVYKFNVDDGRLLGKISSQGREVGRMKKPQDVTLTNEGHVIVSDLGNHGIQMFDSNGKFMRILVEGGKEDGKVWCPCGVTMDMDENIIVSSDHKLQLFDKNGMFIKRIDHEDDGLDIPLGITVISQRPRRVAAVANYWENNIKIFNY